MRAVVYKGQPGEPVAIWGAGPVGLMAAISATLRGASEVYVVDGVQERLDKARSSARARSTQGGAAERADQAAPARQRPAPGGLA